MAALVSRCGQYVVVDGMYATVAFLRAAGDLRPHAVVQLTGNVPNLYAAAQARFVGRPPTETLTNARGAHVEARGAADVPPWDTQRWDNVRVLRYRSEPAGHRHQLTATRPAP